MCRKTPQGNESLLAHNVSPQCALREGGLSLAHWQCDYPPSDSPLERGMCESVLCDPALLRTLHLANLCFVFALSRVPAACPELFFRGRLAGC